MTDTLTTNATRETAQRWFDALRNGDGDAALNVLDENVIWTNTSPEQGLSDIIPWLGTYHGREAVRGTFVIWGELSEVRHFEILRTFYDGDEVVAVVHGIALVKPTGLLYDIEFIQRLQIKDGHIARWTSYWDTSKGITAFRGDMPSRLHRAIREGDVQTAEIVLQAGVDPNTLDAAGELTALMVAAGNGQAQIVDLLLKHGANPNALDPVAGASALHKACQAGHADIVTKLVDNAGNQGGKEQLAFVDLQTPTTGHTPLVEAVWYKWPEIVAYLLDQGAGLNHVTHYGFTLDDHIDYAFRVNEREAEQAKLEEIRRLIDARKRADQAKVASQRLTAAVVANDVEAVRQLLAAGANVEERSPVLDGFNDNHTPLLIAARDGRTEIVALLLDKGADVNAVEDTFGAVPLHKATYNGHVEITRMLSGHLGVDLNRKGGSNGYTPLHDALWHGFEQCARVLLEAGARTEIRAHDGKLAVDIAAEVFGADHPLVDALTGETAPVTARDGKTAWPERRRTGAQAVAEQLRVSGLVGGDNMVVIGNPGSGEELLYLELSKEVRMGLAEPAVGSIVDGASRFRLKPAVAIAHGFVGLCGLLGDVFNAAQRQSPMLVIVGTADTNAHTGETHMWADVQSAAVAARAKYVKNATDPQTLLRDLRDVIVQSMIPPFGPVVFILGSDVAAAGNSERVIKPRLPSTRLVPPVGDIQHLAEQILAAARPCILIGDGVARSGAEHELQELAELLAADVWASMESQVNLPRNHPTFRGNLGHMDDARGRQLLQGADFGLAVGTPIYQTVFHSKIPLFKPGVAVATINHDPDTSLRGHNDVTLPIIGDPKIVLSMLVQAVRVRRTPERAQQADSRLLRMRQEKTESLRQNRRRHMAAAGLTMAKFGNKLEQRMQDLPERPVIFNEALVGAAGLTDHIENVNLPGKYYDTSGGSLGEWAGAVGVALTGTPTIAIIGDGGFNYAPQSLWNAARERLPLGLVVANNRDYGLLRINMQAAMDKIGIDFATIPNPHYYDLNHIDYVRIGNGYGVPGTTVEREDQIDTALNEMFDRMYKDKGPFLIDLVVASS